MDGTLLFIYFCFLLPLLCLRGYVNKEFYIIEGGTKEEQAVPNTTEPRICLSPTSMGNFFCDTMGGGRGIMKEAGTFSGRALPLSYPYP